MHLFLWLHQSKVNADARLDIMEKIVENLIVILVAKMETAPGHGSVIASKFEIKWKCWYLGNFNGISMITGQVMEECCAMKVSLFLNFFFPMWIWIKNW